MVDQFQFYPPDWIIGVVGDCDTKAQEISKSKPTVFSLSKEFSRHAASDFTGRLVTGTIQL